MLLLIDNFDSFTYNLMQAFQILGADVKVIQSDAITGADCMRMAPRHIVIGPGPGAPSHAHTSKELICLSANHSIPLLGVCLGHQCLAEVFGGAVKRAKVPMHGKLSTIKHSRKKLFANLPDLFLATRYHSLIVESSSLPAVFTIDAVTDEEEIMAISHKTLPLYGVQFHPESIATEAGAQLFFNFLQGTV